MKYMDIIPAKNRIGGRTILVKQLGIAKFVYVRTKSNGGVV